jgi:hypothetical protein
MTSEFRDTQEEHPDWNSMSTQQLRNYCKRHALPATGGRLAIIERLESTPMQWAVYEVQRVLSHRYLATGVLEYFIAWEGFTDNERTWEPEENINGADNLIHDYWERHYKDVTAMVLVRDFQAEQPVPSLVEEHEEFYYQRTLWVHNCGIYYANIERMCNYMWSEYEAKRTTPEIVSVLWKFFDDIDVSNEEADTLIVWTDNCTYQNKCWLVLHFFGFLIVRGYFQTIKLRYLLKGHTFMDPDHYFGTYKGLRKKRDIVKPDDYVEMIQEAAHSMACMVPQEEFKHWERISVLFRKPKKSLANEPIGKLTSYGEFELVMTHDQQVLLLIKEHPIDNCPVRHKVCMTKKKWQEALDDMEIPEELQYFYGRVNDEGIYEPEPRALKPGKAKDLRNIYLTNLQHRDAAGELERYYPAVNNEGMNEESDAESMPDEEEEIDVEGEEDDE